MVVPKTVSFCYIHISSFFCFIKPVFIEKGAKIIDSVIGPNVSVGKDSIIESSIISNSIIGKDASISKTLLENSIIGNDAKIKGSPRKLNMGDSSEIQEA